MLNISVINYRCNKLCISIRLYNRMAATLSMTVCVTGYMSFNAFTSKWKIEHKILLFLFVNEIASWFRSNFFIKIFLRQTIALYFNVILQFIGEVELLQCKFIEFILQLPNVGLFYFSYCFRLRINFRRRLTKMWFTWI